ncbi:SNED1-like protein [Mya arenaria]|uniref:SNED1-like protein n=1 Tax=Mya arenaria TaxID=6604 RepID=A0ABY7EDD3_MYAAR|nr:SNED1-like protein [Mya arenaria]
MPKCIINDCKAPDPLPHGTHRKLNGTTYLSVAVYTCLSGYTFYGNNANCGEGASSANANISYPNGTVFESTAHVSCMDGYRINGSHGNDNGTETITCTENGTWSQAHGCDRKDCSNETHAVNADVDFVTGTLFESVANVSCILGYKINGTEGNDNITTTIQCMSTGNWSGAPVCVIKDCGYITTSYANITFGDTHYNENATVSCDKGYKVNLTSGNNVTEETITCLSDDCRDPPTSNHSSRQYNSTTYGNIDECTEKNTCHRNANCTNNIGSYMCLCKNGYDDMATSNSRNQTQWCTNLDPGYYCRCNPGWKGTNCETNVDECTEVTQPCGHNATCKDGYGTYYCKCDRNFPQGDPFVGCFKPVMLDFEKTHEVCAHGDNEILDPINIPYGRFPYLGKYFDVFRPNLNGFLALNYPPLYERYGAENSTLWEKYVDNHIVIAPLWTNIDTRNITGAGLCVHVLSNKTADAKDMKKIEDLVQQYTNRSDFSVNVAIALTWRNATIHSPYMPGYELFKQQNLSMQAIVVTDSLYTFLLFNYDQEQFSIQPDSYTPVAAGYTYPGNFSGKILANRSNFTNLKNGSNVSPAVKGRWLHNVTYITDDMWDEVRCRKFHENQDLKRWTREQLKNSYPCPCYEQDMKEDYTFKQNDSLWTNRDQYTHCYESWFFNPYDIKQRCCYRFGELRKEYPFAIGAEYNNLNNLILEAGFRQCCSAVNSQRYCHLYYDVNPPDDCSSWSPDDEGVVKRAVRKVMEFVGLSKA